MSRKYLTSIFLAVIAAALYAMSTPVLKVLLNDASPTMLAAFMYLGAGVGIGLISAIHKKRDVHRERLSRSDIPYAAGMILLDISAALLLMNGIARTAAANVSLLSNFEIVATALIAFFIFQEKISFKMWTALALITISSLLLSFEGIESMHFSAGSLMVIGASVCWGLENNCTRMLAAKDTAEIVTLKGIFSGSGSLLIACLMGSRFPSFPIIIITMAVGFFSYGLSIFAYIRAQETIGAAKTSAFYALAPFMGAFFSYLVFHVQLAQSYAAGLIIMIAGSALAVDDTLRYSHSHMHTHVIYHLHHGTIEKETITHEHEHSHIGPGLAHHHRHPAA